MDNDPPGVKPQRYGYALGYVTTLSLDLVVPFALSIVPLGSRTGVPGMIALWFAFVFQWLWVLPSVRVARRSGEEAFANGMMSGAWLVFALNGGCWGVFGSFLLYNAHVR